MILKAIFGFFFGIAKWFINILPSFAISENLTSFATWILNSDLFKLVWYFIPINTFKILIGVLVAYHTAKLTMAIIIRIKSFIPTMPSN